VGATVVEHEQVVIMQDVYVIQLHIRHAVPSTRTTHARLKPAYPGHYRLMGGWRVGMGGRWWRGLVDMDHAGRLGAEVQLRNSIEAPKHQAVSAIPRLGARCLGAYLGAYLGGNGVPKAP